jgi:hypothetical protein
MDLTRRELLAAAATAAATVIAACGGGDDDGAPAIDAAPANCLANGTRAVISYNHGHDFTVPGADIAGGNAHSYDITGSADHSHSVSLTAEDMATLADNRPLQVTSSAGGGHTHMISIYCR